MTFACPRCNVAMEDFGPSYFVNGRRWWRCPSCQRTYCYDHGTLTGRGMDEPVSIGPTETKGAQ